MTGKGCGGVPLCCLILLTPAKTLWGQISPYLPPSRRPVYLSLQPILIIHRSYPIMADAADDRLRLLIERVERLEEEKKGIADDIKDVYSEAKAVGYDAKIMRQIVRLRKMKPDDRREAEMMLDTYKNALGID